MASYVESATLKVIDQASGPLKGINAALKETQRAAQALARTSGALSRGLRIGAMTTDLGKVKTEIDAVRRAMAQLGSARVGNQIGRIDANFARATAQANQFAAALGRINAQYASMGRGGSVPRFPPLPSTTSGRGSGGGYNRGGNPPGWTPMGWGDRPGFHPNASIFDRVQNRIVNAAEDGVYRGGRAAMQAADQRSLDAIQRLPVGDRDDNWRVARESAAKYRVANVADLVEIARQSRVQTQDPSRLNEVVDAAAKMQTLASLVYGDTKKGEDTAYKLMRIGIQTGRISDPTKFAEAVDEIGRALIQSGKDVSPTLIESTFRQAGTMIKYGISGQMLGDLVNLSDEERGRAADRIRTFSQDLMRPNLHKDNKAAMESAGLRVSGGGAVDQELLASDAFRWVQKHIVPKLEAKGVDLKDTAKVTDELYRMGFHSSSSQYAMMAIQKRQEIEQERAARAKFKTDDATVSGLTGNNPRLAIQAFGKKWDDLADTLTRPLHGVFSGGTDALARLMSALSSPQNANFSRLGAAVGGLAGGGMYLGGALVKSAIENPGLMIAGALHVKAAASLTAAAAALSGAAGKMGLGGLAGLGGAAGAAKATTAAATVATQASLAAKAATAAGSALKWLGIAGAGVATVSELTNLSRDKSWAENLGVGLSAAKQAAIGGLMFTLPPAGAVIALGDMFGKAAADQLKQVQEDIKNTLRKDRDPTQEAQDESRKSGKFDADDMPMPIEGQDPARRKTGRTFETPEERREREQREAEAAQRALENAGGLPGPWRPLAPGMYGPPVPPLQVPPPDESFWGGIWDAIKKAIVPPAHGSELPPGATIDSPTGGAGGPIPEAGGGADLQAVLNDAVFSIAGSMQSAGGAIEGAAGELAGALSGASGGISEAGGAVVGALQSVAGQIAAISIQAPSVSPPVNTGTNQSIVR